MFNAFSIYTGARIINGASAIVLLSLLTSMLSAESYGAYTLLFTFSMSVSAISYQWISSAAFRFMTPQSTHHAALQGEVLNLYLIVCALVIFFVPLIFYIAMPDLISLPVAFVMVALTMMTGLSDIYLNIFASSLKTGNYVIMTSGRAILSLFLVGMILIAGYHEIGVLVAITISYFIAASFGFLRLRPATYVRNSEIRKQIIQYGMPISVSSIAIIVIDFSDRYMLGVYNGLQEVGTYSAAYGLSQQTTGAILSILSLTIFPRISGFYEGGQYDQVKRHAGLLLVALITLGGGILTCFTWYGGEISKIILGKSVAADSALLLPLISLAIVLGILKSSAFDVPAKLEQHTRYLMVVSLIMAAINVLLNFLLIPMYGAFGAAFSTLLTFAIGMVIALIRYRQFWRIKGLASPLLKVFASMIIMNIVIMIMGHISTISWVVSAPVALGVYLGLLYLLSPFISTKGYKT